MWEHLHIRKARALSLNVVQITHDGARASKREGRAAWFWWSGGELPPLAELATYYAHRFGQEHGYRYDKQSLLWAAPHVRTPEQMQRWIVVAVVRNELVLARPLVAAQRRPWERRTSKVTPQQVRRAMAKIILHVGTPAPPPQVRGKSGGLPER